MSPFPASPFPNGHQQFVHQRQEQMKAAAWLAREKARKAPPAPRAPLLHALPGADGSTDASGVYAYLRASQSPLARQALTLLEAVRFRRHPWLTAHVGRFVRVFALVYALVGGALVAGSIAAASRGVALPSPFTTAAMVAAVPTFVSLLRVAVTVYRVEAGRLQIETGLLARRVRNVELWRVTNLEIRRSFLNRLTGDGTLVVSVHNEEKPLRLRGVARYRGLRELHRQLLDLVFLLRGDPVVKGIYN